VQRTFDRRFGPDFLASVPLAPGVYRMIDAAGAVIYVGKATSLRRRLAQYRLARRGEKHRKMRTIVRTAVRIEVEVHASETEAAIAEARLIEQLRPRLNVAGAFSFLYPLVGTGSGDDGALVLAYSTTPAEHPELAWHGAYRSREVVGDAFFALVRLLARVGHLSPVAQRPKGKRTWRREVRRLPPALCDWDAFFRGRRKDALRALVLALLDKAAARRDAPEVEEDLRLLARFYRTEARRLRRATKLLDDPRWPIPQTERDVHFLRARPLMAARKRR
jgi:excinuclease ABC subunit C